MRQSLTFTQEVKFPARYKKFLWEHQNQKAPLEKLIIRIFTYGKFDDLKWLYKNYPEESYFLAKKYKTIKRGIKFWMEYWNEKRN